MAHFIVGQIAVTLHQTAFGNNDFAVLKIARQHKMAAAVVTERMDGLQQNPYHPRSSQAIADQCHQHQ